MNITHLALEQCAEATGVVVVVDVIRAFTTAAFAFAAGAEEIMLVSTVEEAFELRKQYSDAMLMGEFKGLPPDGFDFGNSPSFLEDVDLTSRRLIQRTSHGTQGIVKSVNADLLLAGSFSCAQATADYIEQNTPEQVNFVNTGWRPYADGEEDRAFAEYVEELLKGTKPDPGPYLWRVKTCEVSQNPFGNPDKPLFPWEDIECCLEIDRFDFAMVVERRDGLLSMKPVRM